MLDIDRNVNSFVYEVTSVNNIGNVNLTLSSLIQISKKVK